jgi:hypothetical protein
MVNKGRLRLKSQMKAFMFLKLPVACTAVENQRA